MDHLKEGPLASVWMAANYEKKLSKQQFLNTNIVTSTNLLNTPINTSSENITLRLSGQLLLGIVRIYSRKTKYLLDDVNDILFKLKNSFKLASGGVLLGSESNKSNINSHNNTINKSQKNVTNLNHNILQDQITSHDLLFQEDLDLGIDDQIAGGLPESIFSQSQTHQQTADNSHDFDHSIEFGRYDQMDDSGDHGADLDFDLNFDNNDFNDFDNSIEVGRDASNPINPEFSLLDINDGSKEINLGIDAPLDTIDDDNELSPPDLNEPLTPPQTELPTQTQPKTRKKLVGITEEGTLKTNKRKLQVDSDEDLEAGITTEELKKLQSLQLNENWREDSYTFKLSENDKLQLIQELSEPAGFKKRKLWDLNSELSRICQNISSQEQRDQAHDSTIPDNDDNNNFDDFNFDQDQSHAFDDLNFDLSIPEVNDEPEEIEDHLIESDVAASTKTVANIIKDENKIDLQTIISKDSTRSDGLPLGAMRRGNETTLNMKKEASKCFFELLVLASRDCISIDQQLGSTVTDIGKDINVTSKDKLLSAFV